jgi:hypothetical protein
MGAVFTSQSPNAVIRDHATMPLGAWRIFGTTQLNPGIQYDSSAIATADATGIRSIKKNVIVV